MPEQVTAVERDGRTARVRLQGDLVIATVRSFHAELRALCRRRDVHRIVLDFSQVRRLDSSGVAAIQLVDRAIRRAGKQLALEHVAPEQQIAFDLLRLQQAEPERAEVPGRLEWIGRHVLDALASVRDLGHLTAEAARQSLRIVTRRARLPADSVMHQLLLMGADALFIVGTLSLLLGMTIAFQGAVQLQRFGAGVFVADLVSMSMVREFAPMITAIILTGRTGAAIAAELGTMRVGSEIDALLAMGVSPVRFLVVPRLFALTLVGPALTLFSMFIGIAGGMVVAAATLHMTPLTFWLRTVQSVQLGDFTHGVGKSFLFAWIIGLAGSHLGLRTSGDASSVGQATTRTVVVSVFLIIVADAVVATISTIMGGPWVQ